MALLRQRSNRKPLLWNVVRTVQTRTQLSPTSITWRWDDKVIARNLSERQAVTLIRKLGRYNADVWYSGEAVGRASHKLVA